LEFMSVQLAVMMPPLELVICSEATSALLPSSSTSPSIVLTTSSSTPLGGGGETVSPGEATPLSRIGVAEAPAAAARASAQADAAAARRLALERRETQIIKALFSHRSHHSGIGKANARELPLVTNLTAARRRSGRKTTEM